MDHNTSRGLGDDIKKITSAVGLDQLAKHIAQLLNEDCGCDDRQAWLNEQTKDWNIYKRRNNIHKNKEKDK